MIEMSGHWIGFYTYGHKYPELYKFITVPFNAWLEKGFKKFVGKISEEVEFGGIDDEAVIRGEINGDEIEFTKYYTQEHIGDYDGGTQSFESENPTIVYYKGKYFYEEAKFKGDWMIPSLREEDDGVFHEDNSSGKWEMWRT